MVLLVLFSVAFAATLAGYAIYKVLPMSEYLYADARVSARSNGLLTHEDYEKLASAQDFNGFNQLLSNTSYESCSHCAGIREFHIELEKRYLKEIEELIVDTPKAFKRLLEGSLMRYEANAIKVLMKAKEKGEQVDDALLVPVGEITPEVLGKLKGAQTVQDMAVVLQRTHFDELFARDFWKGKSEEEREEAIDTFVDLVHAKALEEAKIPNGKILVDSLTEKALTAQVVLLVRAKLRGWDAEKQKELLRAGGMERLIPLADKSLEEIVNADLPDIKAIRESSEAIREGKIVQLEKAIDEYNAGQMNNFARLYPEGAYPIYKYLLARKSEKQKLQLISIAVQDGIPKQEIVEMIK